MRPPRSRDGRATDLRSGSRRICCCHDKRCDDPRGHLFPCEVEFPEERISIRSILIWPEFDQFLVHPYYSAVIFFNQTLIDPEKKLDRNQNRDEKF